jgi:hypothetical protein
MLDEENKIINKRVSKHTQQINKGIYEKNNYNGSNITNSNFEENLNRKNPVSMSEELSNAQFSKVRKILALVEPVKAQAIVSLGEKLYKDNPKIGKLESVLLAAELIHNKDDSFCSTINTLLNDGWGGSLGELLECAREL